MLVSEILTAVYDNLGTDAGDPAFPTDRMLRYVNRWLDGFYRDLPPDVLVASATLAADAGQDHTYTLASQSPAITTYRKALEVRVECDGGLQMFDKRISELTATNGPYYAVTGADEVAVLTTAPPVRAKVALFLRYAYWPSRLVANGPGPAAVPDRFQEIIALGAAEMAFVQGGESQFPPTMSRLLFDGRAQLLSHLGRRSLDVSTRRTTDARPR